MTAAIGAEIALTHRLVVNDEKKEWLLISSRYHLRPTP
jgi:hypothetical protein